jgi:hypothetical protein
MGWKWQEQGLDSAQDDTRGLHAATPPRHAQQRCAQTTVSQALEGVACCVKAGYAGS